ncbi:MAG: hypothetical protein IJV31_03870 [Clostridia bacterium]|nr:hypothetical protein [Clostridia bacterium]
MVKLRDAKCPNCGANIEVNENLEKGICQYCGGTVLIEEAIEKYKLEISGKVEVDGIQGRNTKITRARQHMEIGEYDDAEAILLDIVEEDKFDVESYIELLKIYVIQFKNSSLSENSTEYSDPEEWLLINKITSYYDRIKKIDKNNVSEKLLSNEQSEINKIYKLIENRNNKEKELQPITIRINQIVKNAYEYGIDYMEFFKHFEKAFDTQPSSGYSAYLTQFKINKILWDGSMVGEEYDREAYIKTYTPVTTLEGLQQRCDELEKSIKPMIDNEKKIQNRNKVIDEGINATKGLAKSTLVVIAIIWIAIMLLGSIGLCFTGEIGSGIGALVIFVLPPYLWVRKVFKDRKKNKEDDK